MVSEQAKKKACELVNAQSGRADACALALALVLDEHSARAKAVVDRFSIPGQGDVRVTELHALILPDDEPDAGEAFDEAWHLLTGQKNEAKARMAAAGFQIVRKDQ